MTQIIIGVEEEPRIQFVARFTGERLPELIELPNGDLLSKSGQYLGGLWNGLYKYRYIRVKAERLETLSTIVPWKQYTELTGGESR